MLNTMNVMQLRKYARDNGIDLGTAKTKASLIRIIEDYERVSEPAPAEVERPAKIALYFDHPLYVPALGRVEKGFRVFDYEVADLWLKTVGSRARVATPQEVAAFYGA